MQCFTRFGAFNTGLFVVLSLCRKAGLLKRLDVMVLDSERLKPEFLELPLRFTSGFLDAERLFQLCIRNPELEMDHRFVESALERGDRCYAIVKAGRVVSYGWFSRKDCRPGPNLLFSFDPHYVYTYKAFTLPEYRGKGLHKIIKSQALQWYRNRGALGFVSFVDRANLSCLKALAQLAYRRIGSIYLYRYNGQVSVHQTPGCRSASVSLLLHSARPWTPDRFAF